VLGIGDKVHKYKYTINYVYHCFVTRALHIFKCIKYMIYTSIVTIKINNAHRKCQMSHSVIFRPYISDR